MILRIPLKTTVLKQKLDKRIATVIPCILLEKDRHCYTRNVRYYSHSGVSSSHQLFSSSKFHLAHPTNQFSIPRRHVSAEFYQKYLSSESPPIGFAQNVLEKIYDTTGLPWWASVAFTTFMLRTIITLPLAVYSQRIMAKVELLQPEIMDASKRLKMEVAHATKKYAWKTKYARFKYNSTMKKIVKHLYIRDNCHPFKSSLVLWFQIPMWICMSFALRNMSGYVPVKGFEATVVHPEMCSGGTLWFTDLCLADSTFILPITLGLLNIVIIEMNVLRPGDPSKFQKGITNFLRAVSFVMIPIGASVPSCMCLYWVCSSIFGLGQNIAFKFPAVKRALWIPKTHNESQTPFQDMYKIAVEKYKKKTTKKR